LDILDSPSEEAFDRITRLARKLFDVPVAMVSFIDGHRQWYKSRQGVERIEVPRAATASVAMSCGAGDTARTIRTPSRYLAAKNAAFPQLMHLTVGLVRTGVDSHRHADIATLGLPQGKVRNETRFYAPIRHQRQACQ
jgi:hypothetical protein